jgi:hypothetical protein
MENDIQAQAVAKFGLARVNEIEAYYAERGENPIPHLQAELEYIPIMDYERSSAQRLAKRSAKPGNAHKYFIWQICDHLRAQGLMTGANVHARAAGRALGISPEAARRLPRRPIDDVVKIGVVIDV